MTFDLFVILKMRHAIIPTLIAILTSVIVLAQTKNISKTTSLAGCYSDVTTTGTNDELIVGSGTIVLKKKGNIYTGTFQQLLNDSGEGLPAVPLQNLTVSETEKRIAFTVKVYNYERDKQGNEILRISKATGKITSRGLKLNWRGLAPPYGPPNPLMKRKRNCE